MEIEEQLDETLNALSLCLRKYDKKRERVVLEFEVNLDFETQQGNVKVYGV